MMLTCQLLVAELLLEITLACSHLIDFLLDCAYNSCAFLKCILITCLQLHAQR